MTNRKGKIQNNKGKVWKHEQVFQLKKFAKGNTPTGLIADALGRTKKAIQTKASNLGISLKPLNKSPYTRRKK